MKTIFLASGKSSRMEPLSDKSLFLFCGKPLIIHLLENAQAGGLNNFVVVTNDQNKEIITNTLQKYSFNAEITIQPNLSEGMAGGIIAGLEKVNEDEEVILLGGNDYVEQSAYKEVLSLGKTCDGALLAKHMDDYFPGGYINIDTENTIKSIIEKPGEGNEPSSLVNIVVHYFKKARTLKQALLNNKNNSGEDWYEPTLQTLFESQTIKAVEYKDTWQAIKYPWHILDMQEIVLKKELRKKALNVTDSYKDERPSVHVHETVEIADTARIRGENIIIEQGVKIQDNAVIQGPCYIGNDCIIGNNVLVRNTHLGAKSIVGYNTEVARSYVGQRVTTHSAYIGDSVVENDINFGAFSTTANLRLDKENIKFSIKEDRINTKRTKLGAIIGSNAQIGIHACLMPGCKVKKDELVMSGEIKK